MKLLIDDKANLPSGLKGFYVETEDSHIILINKNIETSIERRCVLAEEVGHYKTSVGNIVNQSMMQNRKQEWRARAWGYEKLVPISKIIKAYENRCLDVFEMAEYLNVTDEYFQDVINHYKAKYGELTAYGEYIILFDPVFKIIEQI